MWADCGHLLASSTHISSCWIGLGFGNCFIIVLDQLLSNCESQRQGFGVIAEMQKLKESKLIWEWERWFHFSNVVSVSYVVDFSLSWSICNPKANNTRIRRSLKIDVSFRRWSPWMGATNTITFKEMQRLLGSKVIWERDDSKIPMLPSHANYVVSLSLSWPKSICKPKMGIALFKGPPKE